MNVTTEEKAKRIAAFLTDHKGENTQILDVQDTCSWTDCFIISTVSSVGHMKGLAHELWDELLDMNITVNNRHKNITDDPWMLIDCSDIVIHLMSKETREFYNLEQLFVKH